MYKKYSGNTVIIDIFGVEKKYPVKITPELIGKIKAFQDIKFTGKDSGEIILVIDNFIDTLLGDNAVAEIYSDDTPDPYEHLNLLIYICEEIQKAVDKWHLQAIPKA